MLLGLCIGFLATGAAFNPLCVPLQVDETGKHYSNKLFSGENCTDVRTILPNNDFYNEIQADNENTTPNENLTGDSSRSTGLQFLEVPQGDDLKIADVNIDDKYFLFGVFSSLMSFLQPSRFPTELLLDASYEKTPAHLLIFQIIKLEIITLIWITFWGLLSVCLPVGVVANVFFSPNGRRLDDEDFPNDSLDTSERWTERSLACLLHLMLFLLLCPIILILAANEEISKAISQSPSVADTIYDDITTFVRNSHMQISFVATSSTDIAIEAVRKDLEDIYSLLGQPYQRELAEETGIISALLALDELKAETTKISSIVSELLSDCENARKAASSLQTQLKEVALQLVVAKQQCSMKDRALCYTLQFSGFDVSLPLYNLTHDKKIEQLEHLTSDGNLNISIEVAQKSFAAIPDQIALASTQFVTDTRTILLKKRTEVYKAIYDLDIISRSITEDVRSGQQKLIPIIKEVSYWDFWRWIVILVISAMLSIIWGLYLCGAPCGCGMTSRTVSVLMSGVALSCLVVLVIWGLGTATLLMGGNGQCFICRPLYDHPQYKVFTKLFYTSNIFYKEGVLNNFFGKNGTVKVSSVLKGCQRDQSIFEVFRLDTHFNIEKLLNYQSWEDLKSLFSNFTFSENRLEITSPSLLLNLQILSTISLTNLSSHRLEFSEPITKRDVGSFADQLNTVARQLSDPVSARKIDNLAFNLRKIVNTELQALSDIRSKILYKLTTLEILLPTLNRHVNQSLSHLKTIEFFLDSQGWQIAERTRRQFIAKIENYLGDLYGYASDKIKKEIGKCHPLWQMYHTARLLICQRIIDPLNGVAFSSFFLIFIFIMITPAVLKTVDFYKDIYDDMFTSVSHRRSRDDLIIDDEGTWATPSSDSPPTRRSPDEGPIVAWQSTTPPRNASEESSIPPPPRPPSAISSRITAHRVPQVSSIARVKSPRSKLTSLASRISGARNLAQNLPSVSRARTPRRGHESLHLVEPIRWKSGSTTPKSWI